MEQFSIIVRNHIFDDKYNDLKRSLCRASIKSTGDHPSINTEPYFSYVYFMFASKSILHLIQFVLVLIHV